MLRYDTAPEAAEAALRSASDELGRIADEIAVLEEQSEQIQAEEWETAEEEADISRRVNAVEATISDLQMNLRSAEEYLSRTNEYWFEEIDAEDEDE